MMFDSQPPNIYTRTHYLNSSNNSEVFTMSKIALTTIIAFHLALAPLASSAYNNQKPIQSIKEVKHSDKKKKKVKDDVPPCKNYPWGENCKIWDF